MTFLRRPDNMRQSPRPVVLLVLGILLAVAAQAADWPRFFGPTANGQAPDKGINKNWAQRPPRVLWQAGLSDGGYAGPAVAEGKVFIIDHQGEEDVVRALDLASGAERWAFRYPDPGGPNYGYARSTPCYDNGVLYVLGRKGQLYCLNAQTGARVWERNIQREFGGTRPKWDYAASPIVDGDRLVVLPGGPNASVAVLNKQTGQTIWAGGGSFEASYATPAIATINGIRQYVVHTATALTGVAAADGRLLWQVPWETKYGVNAAMSIIEDNYVFATSGYGFGCGVVQILPNGPQTVWASKAMMAHFSSPIYYKGYIFGNSDPGDLVCLAPSNGSVLWRRGGYEKGGLVIVDDVIIALTGSNGEIVMVAAVPDGYRELGRVPGLGGQSWTAPIVAEGKLIIRNKNALACLDLM